jgi:hypothetical protein
MKNIRAAVALFVIAAFLAGTVYANTSSINPNVPAQNSPLSSSVLRGNFGNAYSDANTLFTIDTLGANQFLGAVFAGNAGPINIPSCPIGGLGWVPGTGLICNSISALSSPVTQALVFTGSHAIDLNALSLPTKQLGTVIQLGNADTIASRVENDAFGAAAYYTGIRWDGTSGSPTTLQSGDEISALNAWGYNGSAVVGPQASLREYAAAAWTTSSNPTYVDIATTPVGSTTMAEVARFNADGGLALPQTVTGGDMGAGTINAAHVYRQGVELTSGALVEIGGVQTASTSASLTWTGLGTTYASYLLDCHGIVSSSTSTAILLQYGEGGTPTWETASYSWGLSFLLLSSTTPAGQNQSSTSTSTGIVVNSGSQPATAGWGVDFKIWISDIDSSSLNKFATGTVMSAAGSNGLYIGTLGGTYTGDTNALTGFRLIPVTGTLTSGRCSLYGLVP